MYPDNVTAPLGSNVTLECVADQPALSWKINNRQLLDESVINDFKVHGFILDIGVTESVPGGNRTTVTIPATVPVNDSIGSISCQAGPTMFDLGDGGTITFVVYGEYIFCDIV